MRITGIINGKGGVAKTSTAHALATGLGKGGYRALAIDYDRQGNLSLAYGADTTAAPTMYHVVAGDVPIGEAIQHTAQGDIIAGNASLTKIDALFSGSSYLKGIKQLRTHLAQLPEEYTHVIIDNAPNIGGLQALQVLTAATDLVVPMTADAFSAQGVADLQEALENVREDFNPELVITGILIVRHNPRILIANKISGDLHRWAESNQTRIYKTFIRDGVSVKESQLRQQSLFDYAPTSNPAIDYLHFIEEYLD